jgi:predicted NUDIX family NTP pyrophosphohydrolase
MAKTSAGLLPYRRSANGSIEVFLVHPGGPLWAKKDERAWSVVKGEYDPSNEAPESAAEREFTEETGLRVPVGARIDLGEIRQGSGKRVRAWAIEVADLPEGDLAGNTFKLEWPPRSGTIQQFPEVDRAEWMEIPQARLRLVAGQGLLLDRLLSLCGLKD